MHASALCALLSAFAAVSPVPSEAPQEESAASGPSWVPEVDLIFRTDWFGFEPSKMIAPGGPATPDAKGVWSPGALLIGRELPQAHAEVRGRMRIHGKYLHLDMQPYTFIPNNIVRVNTAGLEAWFRAPVTDSLLLGFYHHSAHNISDGSYGDIDMNAVFVEGIPLRDEIAFKGRLTYELRLYFQYFMLGNGTPYQLTPDTHVPRANLDKTVWRGGVDVVVRHRRGRLECSGFTAAPGWAPSSMMLGCAAGFKLDAGFMGDLGQHLLIGPYVRYHQNFSRISEFGRDTWLTGIRFDLLFTDDPVINAPRT